MKTIVIAAFAALAAPAAMAGPVQDAQDRCVDAAVAMIRNSVNVYASYAGLSYAQAYAAVVDGDGDGPTKAIDALPRADQERNLGLVADYKHECILFPRGFPGMSERIRAESATPG